MGILECTSGLGFMQKSVHSAVSTKVQKGRFASKWTVPWLKVQDQCRLVSLLSQMKYAVSKALNFWRSTSQRTGENKICVSKFTSGDINVWIQLFSCENAASTKRYRQTVKSLLFHQCITNEDSLSLLRINLSLNMWVISHVNWTEKNNADFCSLVYGDCLCFAL